MWGGAFNNKKTPYGCVHTEFSYYVAWAVRLLANLCAGLLLELSLDIRHRALDLLVGQGLCLILENEAQGV